ncbi:MAG: DinB family protein [Anaerolineales bacterium]|nr:DinB family protein [Anaerolineales bacterium]
MDDQITPKTKKQTTFLGRLAEAKARLQACIGGLDQAVLCDDLVTGDWTIKDILGHMVSWNQEFRANIAMILRGEHPGYHHEISEEDEFSAWNQYWIALKRDWPFERILAEVEGDYQEVVELIMSLKTGDYRKRGVTPWKQAARVKPAELTKEDTDSVETLVTFHWWHMNHHIGEIEEWRKKWESHQP